MKSTVAYVSQSDGLVKRFTKEGVCEYHINDLVAEFEWPDGHTFVIPFDTFINLIIRDYVDDSET